MSRPGDVNWQPECSGIEDIRVKCEPAPLALSERHDVGDCRTAWPEGVCPCRPGPEHRCCLPACLPAVAVVGHGDERA